MSNELKAFSEPIENGLIRIFLRIGSITCIAENSAPEFVEVSEDQPKLTVWPKTAIDGISDAFNKPLSLSLDKRRSNENLIVWEVEAGGIWIDIPMEEVKEIWVSEFGFHIESEKPRYLAYYIQDVEHRVEWLQTDQKTGEIHSLSEFKKYYKPNPVTGKMNYSGAEVIRCAEMIGRAAQKIDMRTKSALVKFNTDKGRLESLIVGMADKLGYKVTSLDKDTIAREKDKDNSVSHLISLKQ